MKKVIALFLCIALLVSSAALPTSALDGSADTHMTISKEYLPDGSYFVVEIIQQSPLARSSTTSGSKTATHYNSQGTPIWKITVNGTFTYSSGISARATSASATVGIADGNAQFIEKMHTHLAHPPMGMVKLNILEVLQVKQLFCLVTDMVNYLKVSTSSITRKLLNVAVHGFLVFILCLSKTELFQKKCVPSWDTLATPYTAAKPFPHNSYRSRQDCHDSTEPNAGAVR